MEDNRPAKNGWGPGGYSCTCCMCQEEYTGHKRSSTCADCAYIDEGSIKLTKPLRNIAYFDGPSIGWTATTNQGMLWRLFKDKSKQFNESLNIEAQEVVNECIRTGIPPVGSWR